MAVIKTLVTTETKNRFQRMAKLRGLSESKLLRAIILSEIGQTVMENPSNKPEIGDSNLHPMMVRMPRFLTSAVKERAKIKEMALSRWVAALIQNHLTRKPVMAAAELMDLRASNRELAAIGRNINQIARSLNSIRESERLASAETILERITELRTIIDNHQAFIHTLVRASQNAWEADDGTN